MKIATEFRNMVPVSFFFRSVFSSFEKMTTLPPSSIRRLWILFRHGVTTVEYKTAQTHLVWALKIIIWSFNSYYFNLKTPTTTEYTLPFRWIRSLSTTGDFKWQLHKTRTLTSQSITGRAQQCYCLLIL